MKVPNKKLQEHADRQGFVPASLRVFSIAFRICKGYYEPFILNFHKINQEIGKTRIKGCFSAGHLNNVKKQILNSPVVKVVNKFAPYVYEIILLPFADCKKNEKSAQKMKQDSAAAKPEKPEPEKDIELVAEDSGIDQQQLISTDIVCKNAGIKYDKPDLPKIARYGIDAIVKSVQMYKERSLTSFIKNPEGWLRRCLQCGWYKNWRPDRIPVAAIEQFKRLKDFLLDTLGTLPA
mgnify:CR=1 FL=1